jgi:hypothetical protein
MFNISKSTLRYLEISGILIVICFLSSLGNAASEQLDGAVVPDALPDAERVRVSSRLQGVVLESTHRHGRGQRGVQRKSHPGNIARKR